MAHHPKSTYLRWAAAASLTTTAAVHTALAPSHLREAPYAGALFIVLSATALTIALALVRSDHELVWMAAALVSMAALLAYAASRSVGLPSLADDVGDWLNPLGIVAIVSEAATALISLRRLAATASAGVGPTPDGGF